MTTKILIGTLVLLMGVASAGEARAAKTLSPAETVALLKQASERMRRENDWSVEITMQTKRKDGNNRAWQLTAFRRGKERKLVVCFTKPKTDAGKCTLRLEGNLWFYDPAAGKWERRSERLGLGGSQARNRDFDDLRLDEEFVSKYVGAEKVGKVATHHLSLTAKPGIEVAFPQLELWIDVASGNFLKMESRDESGRLVLTNYYIGWASMKDPDTGKDIWYFKEGRIFDEIDKGNSTIVVGKTPNLSPLPPNLFTKAWVESQSR